MTKGGYLLRAAQTTPLPIDLPDNIFTTLATCITSATTFSPAFNMGDQLDFLHVQTPLGFGMITPMYDAFLVLITAPKVKLGLMHYLVTSTKTKLGKISEFRRHVQTADYEGPFTKLLKATVSE